jgi:hypothetical protein
VNLESRGVRKAIWQYSAVLADDRVAHPTRIDVIGGFRRFAATTIRSGRGAEHGDCPEVRPRQEPRNSPRASTSPLIDARSTDILDADGTRSDIGANGGPGGDDW